MVPARRIALKPLTELCRRLAIATTAGMDDRRVWRQEAERGAVGQRAAVRIVADRLAAGQSIDDALARAGDFFPPLFRQMVAVGESSGRLESAYRQLGDYYGHALAARRAFWGQMAWPAFQFGIALLVVAVLIIVAGILPSGQAAGLPNFDPLGMGLVGKRGLILYVNVLIMGSLTALLIVESFRRDARWTRIIRRRALHLPLIGPALQTLALARFTWALQLVLDTPMDLRQAVPLALDATDNDHYRDHGVEAAQRIGAGMTLHESLARTGVFPGELLDSIAVAEQSGMLVESMQRVSKDYQERAAGALSLLAQLLGYALWAAIAAVIIVLIFRLFSFYVGTIQTFSQPNAFN